MASVSLPLNEMLAGQLALMNLDLNPPQPIPVDSFAAETYQSDDPTIFTATSDPNDITKVNVVAVKIGSANLIVNAQVSYKDPNTQKQFTNVPKTVKIPIDIVQGDANTGLTIIFGTPVPIPPTTP